MSNFNLGVQAALYTVHDFLTSIAQYPLFWGFAVGFLISTLVHAFLMSDHPSHVPLMLTRAPAKSFAKIYNQSNTKRSVYADNYSVFERVAGASRLLFSLSLLMFMMIIMGAEVQFWLTAHYPQMTHIPML